MIKTSAVKGIFYFGLVFLSLSGCKKKDSMNQAKGLEEKQEAQQVDGPERITVQHILIGFKGSIPGKDLKRSQQDAEKLATEVLKMAQKDPTGFDKLVKKYTDDQAPGIYAISNLGVVPQGQEFPRDRMVPAFGDIGFKLNKDEIGLATFDRQKSPYGFHIIKRIN